MWVVTENEIHETIQNESIDQVRLHSVCEIYRMRQNLLYLVKYLC